MESKQGKQTPRVEGAYWASFKTWWHVGWGSVILFLMGYGLAFTAVLIGWKLLITVVCVLGAGGLAGYKLYRYMRYRRVEMHEASNQLYINEEDAMKQAVLELANAGIADKVGVYEAHLNKGYSKRGYWLELHVLHSVKKSKRYYYLNY